MHKHRKHKEATHSQHGASGSAAEVKAPEPRAHNQTSAENGEQASPRADDSTKLQWANLGLQIIILAVTAAILWVYSRQLQSMLASNELTRQSLVETKNSNASSSRTAERALKLTEESNRLTREALEESKRQSEASRNQSAKDAAASLSMARETLQRSESPWLVFEQVKVDLTPGHDITVKVLVSNVGRTSAYDPHMVCSLTYELERGIEPWGTESLTKITSIGPGQPFSFECSFPRLGEDKLQRRAVVFVEVVFTDSFKHRQASAACYSYYQGQLSPCQEEDSEMLRAKRLIR